MRPSVGEACKCVNVNVVQTLYIFPQCVPLTRNVEASLKHLIQGPGVVMVMSHQIGSVAHHGPPSPTFMLMHKEDSTVTPALTLFIYIQGQIKEGGGPWAGAIFGALPTETNF